MLSRASILLLVAVLLSPGGAAATTQKDTANATVAADAVAQYRTFLRKLPVAKKESILVARDGLLRYLEGCRDDTSCAESVFAAFCKFFDRVIAAGNAPLEANEAGQALLMKLAGSRLERPLADVEGDRTGALRRASRETRPVLAQLFACRDCGLDFSQGEGVWYLCRDPDWFIAIAAHLPGGEYREYVIFVANESRERLVEDAGFVAPRDTLRLKLVRWDSFIRTHAKIAKAEKMRTDADRLAGWYIVGISNTPAFDTETGRLNLELRESFARFLAANQDCSYYPLIAGLWKELKASDFRSTESVIKYLEKQMSILRR